MRTIDIEKVGKFIKNQTSNTKIYIGGDSEKLCVDNVWYADYTLAVVVHINGNNGCKVFGEVHRERDYDHKMDKPRMRLMNEVMKIAELYLKLIEVVEDHEIEIHIDVNSDNRFGSSCVLNEAVGYIKGMCGIVPKVKPESWAASACADRVKYIMSGY
jgi:predicted RNase H-related nuclease YkuK (DUF458 family)